jgi:hypothetical protein
MSAINPLSPRWGERAGVRGASSRLAKIMATAASVSCKINKKERSYRRFSKVLLIPDSSLRFAPFRMTEKELFPRCNYAITLLKNKPQTSDH